ncbi:MAG: hypothetical protein R2854_11515 [Caldilineaceae bacterium]
MTQRTATSTSPSGSSTATTSGRFAVNPGAAADVAFPVAVVARRRLQQS